MLRARNLFALVVVCIVGIGLSPAAHAGTSTPQHGSIAFVRQDNVWIAHLDGSGGRQLTTDGTGTRIVRQRQVTYSYLTWSPNGQRLLVARFESNNPPGGPYQQGWSLETWTSGARGFAPLVTNINSQDFMPRWSADSRAVSYMGASSYDDATLRYQNTVDSSSLSGQVMPLTHFAAHEGCLDGSTDPSELTFWNLVGPGGIRQTFIWSSSARFLVYATECIHTGIAFRNLVTGRSHLVGRWLTEAALSPDGTRLIGVDQHGLVLSNPDGGGRRALPGTVGARLPVWSPDGHFVYFLDRRTLQALRYRDRSGSLFEFQIDRSSILRADISSGRIETIATLPVHAIANLGVSADGKWLYFTQVSNSDQLYQHLVHAPQVTNALLTRFGPQIDVARIPSAGGHPQMIERGCGQVALPSLGGA